MPKLLHIDKGVVGEEYPLEEGSLRIGREAGSDIRLDDSTVSGRHAVLTIKPSPYLEGLLDIHVDDLGSKNGTLVNGNPVTRQRLKNGDVLSIGTHEFRFIDAGDQPFESTRIYLPDTQD